MAGQFDIIRHDGLLSEEAIRAVSRMNQGAAINGGNLSVRNFGGNIEVFDFRAPPIWVRTTGAAVDGAHPWEEVMREDNEWTAHTDGATGTATVLPLYLADGGEVDEGTICRAWLYSSGTHYIGIPANRHGNYPGLLYLVTNVCPIGETSGVLYVAADDYEISTSGGQAIVAGSFDADAGKVTIRGVVDWTDPDFAAGSGDSFGFYLKVNGENYTGAPVHLVTFVGTGASMQKEMVWELALTQAGTIDLALWAYRVAGSRSLTAASTSRIEVNGNVAGIKVEYRQIIVPPGSHIGPKVCVVNPTDCCIDDDSSTADTASRISVSCCSVPIPAMRMVDLSSAYIIELPGWESIGYGWGEVNFSETFTEIWEQIKKVHYLQYAGQDDSPRRNCLYTKEIPLTNLWAWSRTGFSEAVRTQLLDHYIHLRFWISERRPGEPSSFYDYNINGANTNGPIPAPEQQAYCGFGASVARYSSTHPSPQFFGYLTGYKPHTTNEFYASQPDDLYGNVHAIYPIERFFAPLPTPGTSCIGTCKLIREHLYPSETGSPWPANSNLAIGFAPLLSVVPIG